MPRYDVLSGEAERADTLSHGWGKAWKGTPELMGGMEIKRQCRYIWGQSLVNCANGEAVGMRHCKGPCGRLGRPVAGAQRCRSISECALCLLSSQTERHMLWYFTVPPTGTVRRRGVQCHLVVLRGGDWA